MRLRNIPGAQDAILESPYVVQEPQTKKGHVGGKVFVKKQPLHIEVGMGKVDFYGSGPSASGYQLYRNRDV